jgi:hypothetical protein
MKIDKLIEELKRVRKEEGNIEVTCTGSTLRDSLPGQLPGDVFETTVENLIVSKNHPVHGKAIRLWL